MNAQTSATDLAARLSEFVGSERKLLVDFLLTLAEFERRAAHSELGYQSLYLYLQEALHLSNGCAWRRSVGARLLTAFPCAAEYLADGRLNLTTLVELRDVLTPENATRLLDAATHKSEDDVKALVVAIKPRPAASDCIRAVATTRTGEVPAPLLAAVGLPVAVTPGPGVAAPAALVSVEVPVDRPARIEPSSEGRSNFHLNVSKEFVETFKALQAAMSHVVPDGNFEEVLLIAMQHELERRQKRKFGARPASAEAAVTPGPGVDSASDDREAVVTPGPGVDGAGPAGGRSRYIPASVRREVADRDGRQCSYVSPDGKRCSSTWQLENDHQALFAFGAGSTPSELRLLCRSHNQYAAKRVFGDGLRQTKVYL